MKKSLGANTIIHPHPVLVVGTYDEQGDPNIMNAAWGGIACSKPPCISVALRKATLTYQNIFQRKCFTINIPSQKFIKEVDYIGMVSGREMNKFTKCNLTPLRSRLIDAPMVNEFPYALECKLVQHLELGLHTLFIGEILDIKADEDILGDHGLPDIEKVKPLIFGSMAGRHYYGIGEKLGEAFSIGKDL